MILNYTSQRRAILKNSIKVFRRIFADAEKYLGKSININNFNFNFKKRIEKLHIIISRSSHSLWEACVCETHRDQGFEPGFLETLSDIKFVK